MDMSTIWKTKKRTNVQAKLLIGQGKPKKTLLQKVNSEFQSCPRSFASWPTVHFSDNLSDEGIILGYTSKPERGLFNL